MWAITDFTEENGATRIIPGSHLRDEAPNPLEHYESVPAAMSKGSVLVWVGSLWHGGGANHTETRRVGIAMNYCAGYIRQQENQQLGLPPALVKTFPRRLQELIGYWSTTASSATSTSSTRPRSSSPRTRASTWSGTCSKPDRPQAADNATGATGQTYSRRSMGIIPSASRQES